MGRNFERLRGCLSDLKGGLINACAEGRTFGLTLSCHSESYAESRARNDLSFFQPAQSVSLQLFETRIGAAAQAVFSAWLKSFSVREICVARSEEIRILGIGPLTVDSNLARIPDPLLSGCPEPLHVQSAIRSLACCEKRYKLVVDLTHAYAANYFHWFMDILPRLREAFEVERVFGEPLVALCPGHMEEWQEQSLRLLLGGRQVLRHSVRHGLFRVDCERAVLATAPRFNGGPDSPFDLQDPLVIHWLRSGLVPQLDPRGGKGRTLVCRAGSRRFRFEPGMQRLLEAEGFELVFLEGLSLGEQMRIFRESAVIVAAHGSSLTNVLFSERCRVFEIFPRTYGTRADYFQLAIHCGHTYDAFIADSIEGSDDLIIDLACVKAICRFAG